MTSLIKSIIRKLFVIFGIIVGILGLFIILFFLFIASKGAYNIALLVVDLFIIIINDTYILRVVGIIIAIIVIPIIVAVGVVACVSLYNYAFSPDEDFQPSDDDKKNK